jgi:hypothetical protein
MEAASITVINPWAASRPPFVVHTNGLDVSALVYQLLKKGMESIEAARQRSTPKCLSTLAAMPQCAGATREFWHLLSF